MKQLKFMISGGGTGGHIFPALSIANALKQRFPEADFLFVGAEGRMEMEKVPAAGYPIVGLPVQGLYRSLTPKNIKVVCNVIKSIHKAKKIIQSFGPDAVIGVGGYASAPVLWQAARMGIPTLIQEQNSYAGVTNKLLGKKCKRVCVAYDGMERFFPQEKIVLTGNPVRSQLKDGSLHLAEAYAHFGLNANKKTLLIIGGSLGARTINESVLNALDLIQSQQDNYQIIWQTGKYYYPSIQKQLENHPLSNLLVTDFVSRMDWAYAIADLVVSRAGASSISELSMLGKACILVPSPNVAEDHQTKNAQALEQKGAAILIPDIKASGCLLQTAFNTLSDSEGLHQLSENIKYFAKPMASEDIVNEIIQLIPALQTNTKNYYFLGIGGIGMSAIARYLHQQGCRVAGYDLTPSPLTQALEQEGINIQYQDNVQQVDPLFLQKTTTVIYTPAIPSNLSLLQYYQQQGNKIIKRSQALGVLTANKKALCVAGSHGKTTTSTLLAHLIKSGTGHVNAFLGGISKNYQSNLLTDTASPYVVVEADEFDRSFLQLHPHMAVITATDPDHLDIYGTHQNMLEAFAQFSSQINDNGVLLIKKDILLQHRAPASAKVFTYALSDSQADFYATNITYGQGTLCFDFMGPDVRILQVTLGVPVYVNIENAVAAMAIAHLCGVSDQAISQGVASFSGTRRRFDKLFDSNSCIYIDDYAHHPAEIAMSINSVRKLYPGKKICGVFQPHLYTRTRDLCNEFAQSLSLLDEVILLDIYPAREQPIEGVNSAMLLPLIQSPQKSLCSKEELINTLQQKSFDVLITLGAGNIDRLTDGIAQMLQEKNNA